MDRKISLDELKKLIAQLKSVAPETHRTLTEPVEVVAERIMARAKETGCCPLAVAKVYMRPEPDLRVVVPVVDFGKSEVTKND